MASFCVRKHNSTTADRRKKAAFYKVSSVSIAIQIYRRVFEKANRRFPYTTLPASFVPEPVPQKAVGLSKQQSVLQAYNREPRCCLM